MSRDDDILRAVAEAVRDNAAAPSAPTAPPRVELCLADEVGRPGYRCGLFAGHPAGHHFFDIVTSAAPAPRMDLTVAQDRADWWGLDVDPALAAAPEDPS